MLIRRIVGALLIAAGTTIVAAPMIMRLGWLMSGAGVVLGTSLGVIAGVLWASGGPLIPMFQRTSVPAVEVPPPPPA